MAISGPKGPPSDAKGPRGLDSIEKNQDIQKQKAIPHTQPSSDEFDRIAESLAGSDFDQSDSAKRRKRGQTHRRQAIISRTVTRIGSDLQKLQREAGQILSIIASQAFSAATIERHKRELARLRERIQRAYRHVLKSQRALREKQLGLDTIGESKLEKVEQELERLNQFETQWGKAMAALELTCDASADEQPRRLNVHGADIEAAGVYAAISNPNTVAIDLATSALMLFQTKETAPEAVKYGSNLGRTLNGQKILEQIITANPKK